MLCSDEPDAYTDSWAWFDNQPRMLRRPHTLSSGIARAGIERWKTA